MDAVLDLNSIVDQIIAGEDSFLNLVFLGDLSSDDERDQLVPLLRERGFHLSFDECFEVLDVATSDALISFLYESVVTHKSDKDFSPSAYLDERDLLWGHDAYKFLAMMLEYCDYHNVDLSFDDYHSFCLPFRTSGSDCDWLVCLRRFAFSHQSLLFTEDALIAAIDNIADPEDEMMWCADVMFLLNIATHHNLLSRSLCRRIYLQRSRFIELPFREFLFNRFYSLPAEEGEDFTDIFDS